MLSTCAVVLLACGCIFGATGDSLLGRKAPDWAGLKGDEDYLLLKAKIEELLAEE